MFGLCYYVELMHHCTDQALSSHNREATSIKFIKLQHLWYAREYIRHTQVIANNDSVMTTAALKKWSLSEHSRTSSLQQLVETLTRNSGDQFPFLCTGCRQEESCNCTVTGIKNENTFNIYVVLESKGRFGTKWCNQTSLASNSFVCNVENNETILANQLCDGFEDCEDGRDEADIICKSGKTTTVITLMVVLFGVASGIATYLELSGSIVEELKESEEPEKQVLDAMKLIVGHVKDPVKISEEHMESTIGSMSKLTQVDLLKSLRHAEMKGTGSSTPGILIKTAVKTVFTEESKTIEILNLVKESEEPTIFKTDMFDYVENGVATVLAALIDKVMSSKVKLVLLTILGILVAIIDLLMVPFCDVKDITTILSIIAFYNNVLQQRASLIGDIPLNDFIVQLAAIYIVTLLLKQMTVVQAGLVQGKVKYLLWVPFAAEAWITVKKIRQIVNIYHLKQGIKKKIGEIDQAQEVNDTTAICTEVWIKSNQIHQIETDLEENTHAIRTFASVQSLCDILQAGVLIMLLLRSDERVRSLFSITTLTKGLGGTGGREDGNSGTLLF